uniref:Translation initiation factor beta propellor-like domain-containing protein n=1 Tax=Trypanosoma congolense (strain IL3000) TaxID=1068625 RepID=G0ULY2_TRYCI|nr:conserved hypothetical protein [Trypanosoma congolense IL3000]
MKPGNTETSCADVLPLPIVLRKDKSLLLATFSERNQTLTEIEGSCMTGDYSECELCFNPARPTAFAHATTTHVRYSEVVPLENSVACTTTSENSCWTLRLLFEVEERNTVALSFSTTGSILVTYSIMDSKRPEGNMALYHTATGQLLRRCMQARWPGMVWSQQDVYCVRPVQGCLHVLEGDLLKEDAATLSKLELQLPQDAEIELSMCPSNVPLLALFKPFHKQTQGTLCLYRLPNLSDGPMYQATFGRAESATLLWSGSGNHLAVLVKSERDSSGKSYYGTVSLYLVDVGGRKMKQIKFSSDESVHDCQWSPTVDELMVIHGTMPVNKTTLYDKAGVALMTFGEAPRNVILWSPNGRFCTLGGTGNLAGDFVFFDVHPSSGTSGSSAHKAGITTDSSSTAAVSTGEFNQKSSVQFWAPDSHIFLCAVIYTRLRIDNKLVFYKNNGEHLLTQKYPILYGAHWVQTQRPQLYPMRSASPRKATAELTKPQPYRPPHASEAASALLKRPGSSTPKQAKPAGPPGATVVVQKKKRR